MTEIKSRLEVRQKQLLKLKAVKERALKKAPDGTLHIHKKKSKIDYYHREGEKKVTGRYIRKENLNLARQLAQKDYDSKILNSINKELNAIQKYISNYPAKNIEEIYSSLSLERQNLTIPIIETDEDYIRRWQELPVKSLAVGRGDQPTVASFLVSL